MGLVDEQSARRGSARAPRAPRAARRRRPSRRPSRSRSGSGPARDSRACTIRGDRGRNGDRRSPRHRESRQPSTIEAWLSSSEKIDVARAGERADRSDVREVARAEEDARLAALERGEPLLESPVDRHRARTRGARRRRRRPSASPRPPRPRGRADGRRARGSCWSTAAAPGWPSSSTRGPCGPEISRRRLRSPARSSSARRSSISIPSCAHSCADASTSPPTSAVGSVRLRFARSEAAWRDPTGARSAPSAHRRQGPLREQRGDHIGSRRPGLQSSATRSGRAVQPARAVVRPWVRAVVGLARTFRPSASNIARSCSGSEPERGEEVAHHHAVEPGLDGERLQLAEVLHAPAAEAKERVRQDQAEDRDPLDRLPRVHQLAVAELRAGPRVEQVDRDARRVDRGELEGHLDALLAASRRG